MTPNKPPLQWTPNKYILVLAAVFLPILLALGLWQLDRAEQKREIEQALEKRQSQPPVPLERIEPLEPYTRVMAEGEFDQRHIWLLDNRQRDGRPGYEVVQPLRLSGGGAVLVNRGWLAAGESREQLPEIPMARGVTTVFAQVSSPSDHPMLSAEGQGQDWPRVVTQIEPDTMSMTAGEDYAPYYLKIDVASAGALRTGWQAVNMSSEKHTGYAVQWFAMALALVILTVFANTNLAQRLTRRTKNQ